MRSALVLVVVAGCGRIAFEPLGGDAGSGASPDGSDDDASTCTAPASDGPTYRTTTPLTACSNCSAFDQFDMSCGANDVDTCGTVGGRDVFIPVISEWNGPLRASTSAETFASRVAIFSGMCEAVTSASTPLACSATCGDGSSVATTTIALGQRYCVVIEQADINETELVAFINLNPSSTGCF